MTQPLPPFLVPMTPSDPVEVEDKLWSGLHGSLAFDVGARMGENFSYLARLGFTKVVACEPQATSFAALQDRFGSLDKHTAIFQVRLREVAVTEHTGHVMLAAVPRCMEKGELVTPGLKGMEWEPPDWADVPLIKTRATTLDELEALEGTPDLVVIDTEGHEYQVLKGGPSLIENGKTDFLIEFHAPDLHELCRATLENRGYTTVTIRHPHYVHESKMWWQHGWLKGFAPNRSTLVS